VNSHVTAYKLEHGVFGTTCWRSIQFMETPPVLYDQHKLNTQNPFTQKPAEFLDIW